ncbi:hypothetical protein K461DRAFT_317661 [Myriangium duriaei CBS 260.36]|uniref:Uncharacterized protein n=1 Tax=Myriangium duriaei CBS 260.36 TaxID=1168546 RepID=A0A9P4J9R9_9PEZI|nr:hypothetical protein K461DRAFT_317661 [Myriangium duriaei CBS 260.36]
MLSRAAISRVAGLTHPTIRSVHSCSAARTRPRLSLSHKSYTIPSLRMTRFYSDRSLADEKIEEITELYATAKDEVGKISSSVMPKNADDRTLQFEIAMEETEKQTVYAEDDRTAAREELEKVQQAYKDIINGQDEALAEEVQKRIGQRIRELEQGVKAMEELAQNQD